MKEFYHTLKNCCQKKVKEIEPEKLPIEADGHNQKVMEEALKIQQEGDRP